MNGRLSAEAAERESVEQGLRLAGVAVETTTEGVVITDPELRILAVNRAFSEITGYDAAEVVGQLPSLLQSGRHDPAFYEAMWASILGCGRWRGEIWNRRKNGAIYPELLSISVVRDQNGQVTNYVGVFSDIGEVKESEARFEFLAQHDPLTGLPNRLLFATRGERALARARSCGGRVALMSLDLELEITESSVMADLDAGVEALRAVKALGVTIALDDFGTGYSSLNYLRRFPLDRLKLDGSFVRQIADDETAEAIAHAAIEVGHGLRLAVCAEGVETPTQLSVLRSNGCDAYQGHLFAAALPPDDFANLLRGGAVLST